MTHRQSLVGRSLAEPERVWSWLDGQCAPLGAERLAVSRAAGRVSAGTVAAAGPVPPTATAAADGYALLAAATVGAGDYNPLPLHLAKENRVTASTALRVAAGDLLAHGADAVLSVDDAMLHDELLEVTTPVAVGENVIPAGRELESGGEIVSVGRRLSARDLAMLRLAGVTHVDVVRRPRVGLACVRGRAADASAVMARAMLDAWGCAVPATDFAEGAPDRFGEMLGAAGTDLLVTIGGTGSGDDDFAIGTLEQVGALAFHGIAVHPGERAAVGRAASRVVIQAPGAPLACLAIMELFVRRAVRGLCGLPPARTSGVAHARLSRKIASRPGRLDMCRVTIEDGRAHPVAIADATTLATAARADGYVLVPVRSEGYDAGTDVTVYLFDDTC